MTESFTEIIIKNNYWIKQKTLQKCAVYTFLTVLSGSNAMSGMLASTIKDIKLSIKLDDLEKNSTV